MSPEVLCAICRRPESAHHTFIARAIPSGCVCNPRTWTPDMIRPVCEQYQGIDGAYCSVCEHDQACHRGPKG